MRIKSFIGFMLVYVLLQACTKDSTAPCIDETYSQMKNGHLSGKISQFSCKGQPVYYVSIIGVAINYTIYDVNCNVLCESYGFCQDSILGFLTDEVVIIEHNP